MTTQLLERAFAEAAKLPSHEQDALATLVMEEMEAEKKWEESFSRSQDALAEMAEHALAEHKANKTRPLDADEL